MTAATQQKWLTAPKGKLSKVDLSVVLSQEAAWATLSRETKQQLYHLLPPSPPGEAPYDIDVHPFATPLRPYIEDELRRWQDDLKDGKETKAWRDKAMEAGKERTDGLWDEWKEAHRQSEWKGDENDPPAKKDGASEAEDDTENYEK